MNEFLEEFVCAIRSIATKSNEISLMIHCMRTMGILVEILENNDLTILCDHIDSENDKEIIRKALSAIFYESSIVPLVNKFAWAIPTPQAIKTICKYSPLVEIGAGGGYWAHLLSKEGAKIVAYDDSSWVKSNAIYRGEKRWFDVQKGNEDNITNHLTYNLFLCYPPADWDYPLGSRCLQRFKGEYLIYVGSVAKDGCTGDNLFLELINDQFEEIELVSIPRWPGHDVAVHIYRRQRLESEETNTKAATTIRNRALPSSACRSINVRLLNAILTQYDVITMHCKNINSCRFCDAADDKIIEKNNTIILPIIDSNGCDIMDFGFFLHQLGHAFDNGIGSFRRILSSSPRQSIPFHMCGRGEDEEYNMKEAMEKDNRRSAASHKEFANAFVSYCIDRKNFKRTSPHIFDVLDRKLQSLRVIHKSLPTTIPTSLIEKSELSSALCKIAPFAVPLQPDCFKVIIDKLDCSSLSKKQTFIICLPTVNSDKVRNIYDTFRQRLEMYENIMRMSNNEAFSSMSICDVDDDKNMMKKNRQDNTCIQAAISSSSSDVDFLYSQFDDILPTPYSCIFLYGTQEDIDLIYSSYRKLYFFSSLHWIKCSF